MHDVISKVATTRQQYAKALENEMYSTYDQALKGIVEMKSRNYITNDEAKSLWTAAAVVAFERLFYTLTPLMAQNAEEAAS